MVKWIVILFAGIAVSVLGFETDDALNRRIMANEVFYKANLVADYKLNPDDGAAWDKFKHLDLDANGEVSFEEFLAEAELPYPVWNGEVLRNIVYKRINGDAQLLDVYKPRVATYDAAPVLVYVHGGGWSGGRKELSGAIKPIFEALSSEGFVCVSVMYRLVKMWDANDPVLMRDCVVDCRDSLRFLRKHGEELGLDPDRIVVFGDSAGGHIAQLLTLSSADDFKGDASLLDYKVSPIAGISWYGPSDFRNAQLFKTDHLKDKFKPGHWGSRITKTSEFVYVEADERTKQMVDEVSPVVYLKKTSAPLLHIHGDQDVVVSPNHAHHLKACGNTVDASVEVMMVEGAGHGWWAQGIAPDRDAVEQMTVDFALKQGGGRD